MISTECKPNLKWLGCQWGWHVSTAAGPMQIDPLFSKWNCIFVLFRESALFYFLLCFQQVCFWKGMQKVPSPIRWRCTNSSRWPYAGKGWTVFVFLFVSKASPRSLQFMGHVWLLLQRKKFWSVNQVNYMSCHWREKPRKIPVNCAVEKDI